MDSYNQEKARRVAAFERHLRLMVQRRGDEKRIDCAITFSEDRPEDVDKPALVEAKAKALVMAGEEGGDEGSQSDASAPAKGDHSGCGRFIQFVFMHGTFYLDLPRQTLFAPEARQILRQRSGFFWLRERRFLWMDFREWKQTWMESNPLQKEYLNADTAAAAQDMGFVLYSVWKFPVDTPLYFKALRFKGRRRRPWEGQGAVP